MSETKMQFIERMMNDPNVRQRLKASEQRRAYCEDEWIRTQEAADTEPDQPTPEPVPEADPQPESEDEAEEQGDAEESEESEEDDTK